MSETLKAAQVDCKKYVGPTTEPYHNRKIKNFDTAYERAQINARLSKIGPSGPEYGEDLVVIKTFDSLLAGQIKRAVESGQQELVLLDIGSGDAGIFTDFLSNSDSAPASKKLLQKNPNLRIKMIGFTDSPTPEDHLRFREIKPADPQSDTNQVTALNYFYSLSRQQTLQGFLDQTSPGQLDLVLGTWSLQYLPGTIFRETVETVVDRLRPGGKMMCVGYGNLPPGFTKDDKNRAILFTSGNIQSQHGIKQWIDNPGWFLSDETKPIDKVIDSLKRTVKMMQKMSIHDSNDEDAALFRSYTQDLSQGWLEAKMKTVRQCTDETEKRQKLKAIAETTMDTAIEHLFISRRVRELDRRMQIMREFQNRLSDTADIVFYKKFFEITKRS